MSDYLSGRLPVLALTGVTRRYAEGDGYLEILRGVDAMLWPGQAVALIAPSGAGKSTLLHIAGLLERPDGGVVAIDGEEASQLDDGARTALRRDKIGFVYQFHHLLPEFTALENVMTPQLIAGLNKREARERAHDLLDYLGLGSRANHRPSELSGGLLLLLPMPRAVANAPALLLADEPTGNLDPDTAEKVFGALMTLVRATGLAAVIATHNLDLAARMDRRWTLRNGLLVELE